MHRELYVFLDFIFFMGSWYSIMNMPALLAFPYSYPCPFQISVMLLALHDFSSLLWCEHCYWTEGWGDHRTHLLLFSLLHYTRLFSPPKKIVGTSIGGITSISVGYGHVCGGIFLIFDEWRRDQPTVNSAVSSQASLGCLEKSEQARRSKPVSSVLHNFSFKPLPWVPVCFALSDGLLSVS